jgi:hypothetical protein
VATEGHTNPFAGLPAFLSDGSKVTIDHNGAFQKGFLHYSPSAGFHVAIGRNLQSNKIDFTILLPSFRQNWSSLVGDNILLPGHTTVSSFLRSNTSNNAPSANFVSAKNLLHPCPPSLLKALYPTHLTPIVMFGSSHMMKKKGG